MIKANIPVLINRLSTLNAVIGKVIVKGNQIINFDSLTEITPEQEEDFNAKLKAVSPRYMDCHNAIAEAFTATEPLPDED